MTDTIEIGDLVKARKIFDWNQTQFEWGDWFGSSTQWGIILGVDETNLDNAGPIYHIRFIDGDEYFVYRDNIELISKCGKNSRDIAPRAQEEKNGRKKI
jgi:hypothetical protein